MLDRLVVVPVIRVRDGHHWVVLEAKLRANVLFKHHRDVIVSDFYVLEQMPTS